MTVGEAAAFADADFVLVGPAPPLRGGIAQHTLRLGEALRASGKNVAAASFRRLYPAWLFPGRSQRTTEATPPWSHEVLDVVSPATWLALGRSLAASGATVVVQWWHPVAAPAYVAAIRRVPRGRLVAVCHNATPHEPLAGAAAAARFVLSRCGRVVCHSAAEAARVRSLLGASTAVVDVALPCLLAEAALDGARGVPPELVALPPGARLLVAAGHQRPYKAVDLLLCAWTRARRPPEARLVVVGESYLKGRERRRVADLVRADPSILLVDRYVEDAELVRFLVSAEALVAAHRSASQSGLLPIARALGLPCIVSDAGGLPEQARLAGEGAMVVRAGDEAALRVEIERLFDEPARRRAVRRESAEARDSDWQRVVEAISVAARP